MNRNGEENREKNREISRIRSWFMERQKKGVCIRKDQMLIVLLCGVLLLVIAFPVEDKRETEETYVRGKEETYIWGEEKDSTEVMKQTVEVHKESSGVGVDYAEEMEEKLERVLFNMEQVGKVDVLITLKASEEKIVEKDIPVNRSNTEEQDSGGGSRSVNNVDTQENTIYETDSGKSTPYVVKTTSPLVEGVVVVCEGAGVGSVNKNITEAIEVLFGIEPHKIKVVKMKTS